MLNKLKKYFLIFIAQFNNKLFVNKKINHKTDKVLIIKGDAIGDFIMWLDSAKEYKKIFANKKIYLMCNPICEELAKKTGYFDIIIPIDKNKMELDKKYFVDTLNKYDDLEFDYIIQAPFSRNLHFDLLLANIKGNKKIGYVSDESKTNLSWNLLLNSTKKKLDTFYDYLIDAKFDDKSLLNDNTENVMEIKRNGLMISYLTNDRFMTDISYISENDDKKTKVPDNDYFVIFPGGSTNLKMWDIKNFLEVTKYILNKSKLSAYVCGSKGEINLGEYIVSNTKFVNRVFNFCGKTDILESIEVIRNAKFIISNDTSGIHIAAATKTPSICVLGRYNYGRFLPYDSDKCSVNYIKTCSVDMKCTNCKSKHMTLACFINVLLKKKYICIEKITTDMMIKKIDELLCEI